MIMMNVKQVLQQSGHVQIVTMKIVTVIVDVVQMTLHVLMVVQVGKIVILAGHVNMVNMIVQKILY